MADARSSTAYTASMLELPASDVHVWTMPLDLSTAKLITLGRFLSAPERDRADRFRFDQHRRRFVAARGFLRNVLGLYLNEDPAALKFRYGRQGKPALAAGLERNGLDLHFNLAHSEGLAMLAVSRTGPVGIDFERVRTLDDAEELVARFFCPAEVAVFQDLPADVKCAAFFNLWTRKEAWLKATGEGIGHSLNRVQVSFRPGEPARLIHLPADLGKAEEWSLFEPITRPGFTAALARWGSAPRVCYRTWEPGEETVAANLSARNERVGAAEIIAPDLVVASKAVE